VGAGVVSQRSYAIVRLHTAGGLEGVGYSYGRGLPVARIVTESLAPLLHGADSSKPEHVRQQLLDAYWPYAGHGLFWVALSVVDLALWDLLGKRLGAPLADLLGRYRSEVPITCVAGYTYEGDSTRDLTGLQEEVARWIRRGVRSIKLTVGAAEPAWDAARLAAVRNVVGDDCLIAADAFRSFTSLDDALRRLRLLAPYDLAFVEDAFPESLAPLLAELRRRSGMSLALGESLNGHRAYRDLIEQQCVDVVRCDATQVGGVREFMAVAALASAHGLQTLNHVHQDVHIHFAAALPNLYDGGLEYNPPESGLDCFHQLLRRQLEVRDGLAIVPERPGLGLEIDWDAVRECAR
jgi:L-alanine-DL-glutamate epimerase-like enolase superfamily enzyme